jgi:hypothetical protein
LVSKGGLGEVKARLYPDAANHLLNYKRHDLYNLEERYKTKILITGDASLAPGQFEIESSKKTAEVETLKPGQVAGLYDDEDAAYENGDNYCEGGHKSNNRQSYADDSRVRYHGDHGQYDQVGHMAQADPNGHVGPNAHVGHSSQADSNGHSGRNGQGDPSGHSGRSGQGDHNGHSGRSGQADPNGHSGHSGHFDQHRSGDNKKDSGRSKRPPKQRNRHEASQSGENRSQDGAFV